VEEREIIKLAKEQAKLKKLARKNNDDDNEDEEEKQLFLNPLLAFKQKKKERLDGKVEDESDAWSDDDKYEPKETRDEKRAKKEKERKLIGKRKRSGIQGDMDEVNAFFKNDNFEEVPENDMSKLKKKKGPDDLPDGYSSMDSDDIAETRALAKKMMRKKFRTETIDASYSRYAHEEDDDIIPAWFLEDEVKNNRPNINLTQDEIDEEKRILREWNARPSKKVTEAKARKKMRLVKALSKIKNKAEVIAKSSEVGEGSKMRQI
jgi:AdoMet-dependent rRNA methyltransferase SPB1